MERDRSQSLNSDTIPAMKMPNNRRATVSVVAGRTSPP